MTRCGNANQRPAAGDQTLRQDPMKIRYLMHYEVLLSVMLLKIALNAEATEKETARWAQAIREDRPASVLCERILFDENGEKRMDVKKHQLRRQSEALFFRELKTYEDATNYANSRTLAAGRWGDIRWAVQFNDVIYSTETENKHATNSAAWLFGNIARQFTDHVFCWGINQLDPATLVETGVNQFRASLRHAGFNVAGEVLEFSEFGLPTKLVCVFRGPSGPYQTNLIEYRFDAQAKLPCLPKEVRCYTVRGEKRIPRVFLNIEECQFADHPMPKEQFLPGVFSNAAPFRFELVTTEKGNFQRAGDDLVKVIDRSSAKPVGARMRYLYFLLVVVAGGTLVLALRHRSTAPKKSSL